MVSLNALLPPAIAIRYLAERVFAKQRRHVIKHTSCEHRGREVAILAIGNVGFFAQADEFLKVELSWREIANFLQPTIGYECKPFRLGFWLAFFHFHPFPSQVPRFLRPAYVAHPSRRLQVSFHSCEAKALKSFEGVHNNTVHQNGLISQKNFTDMLDARGPKTRI